MTTSHRALYPHQVRAIDAVSHAFSHGTKSVLVVSPTGSGKGTIWVEMAIRAVAKGLTAGILLHRQELGEDQVKRLQEAGITRLNVMMGQHPMYDPGAPVHIMGVDSLRNRTPPKIDLLGVDEAHRSLAQSYISARERIAPRWTVGFTGTPVRLDRQPLCRAFEKMVVAAQPSELLAAGLLAPARVFTIPEGDLAALEDVAMRGHDYDLGALGKVMNTRRLVGGLVDHWVRHAEGVPTVVFCVDIPHSEATAAEFRARGHAAEHVDGTTPKEVRKAVQDRVRSGETTIVCQCQIWIEGVDLPELKCAVLARPTTSITIYLQSIGRVLRVYGGQEATILDHAGIARKPGFGLPQDDREWQDIFEDTHRPSRGGGVRPTKTCPLDGEPQGCGMLLPISVMKCECGYEFPKKELKTIEGDLVEVTPVVSKQQIKEAREAAKKDPRGGIAKATFGRLWMQAYKGGFDSSWVIRRFAERFGDAPDTTWTPPPRPLVVYTHAQKTAEYTKLLGVAHRQGKPRSWVEERYRNKIGEPTSALASPPAALPSPVTEPTRELESVAMAEADPMNDPVF